MLTIVDWLVMKHLFTNQNFHKAKFPLVFEFNFLKKNMYVNKGTLRTFDIFYLLIII